MGSTAYENLLPDLIKIIFGFGLTAVVGSWIARRAQERSWDRQWLIERRAEDLREMTSVFEELSRLLDRRWYRSAKLLWAMQDGDPSKVEAALVGYSEVLFEWNDNINRTLAQLQIYYGAEIRQLLDEGLGRRLVELGAALEEAYRAHTAPPEKSTALDGKLEEASRAIYAFNVRMLEMVSLRRSTILESVPSH